MRPPRFQISTGTVYFGAIWLVVAILPLRWILGSADVPLGPWWCLLAVSLCGVVASLCGYGGICTVAAILLLCVALLTMDHWMTAVMPS